MDIISGSIRYKDGHWSLNCYQISYKNYVLEIIAGYRHSTTDSCLLCDFSLGPFLAKTEMVKNVKFDAELKRQHPLQFLDIFMQAKYVSKSTLLTCPDVMSNVNSVHDDFLLSKNDCLPFAQKYFVNRIHMWNGRTFHYTNAKLKMICEKTPGVILSPACTEVTNDFLTVG